LSRNLSPAWYVAFFPSGVAFGMLSVLVPLYLVQELGGSLFDLGVMASASTLVLMPASIYIGKLPDSYGRSKPFILASYMMVGIVLFLMSITRSVIGFQILYVLMNLANYLTGPSTSILIAESYERSSWGRTMAKRNFTDGLAQAIGLGICTITVGPLGYGKLLSITSYLVFASLLIALLVIRDPPIHIERFLGRIENPVEDLETLSFNVTSRGGISKSRHGSLRLGETPKMSLFGIGMTLFAFAASNAFTSFPIYLTSRAGFTSSMVFGIFFIRSLVGTFSYLAVSSLVTRGGGLAVKAATTARVVLILSLAVIPILPTPYSILLALVLLSSVSFSWSLYALGTEVVTVQYAGSGGLGVYDAMANLGSSAGGFLGCAMPAIIGFEPLFIASSLLFLSALISFVTSHV
jgi:predicted MFS family arabinose efflux permease